MTISCPAGVLGACLFFRTTLCFIRLQRGLFSLTMILPLLLSSRRSCGVCFRYGALDHPKTLISKRAGLHRSKSELRAANSRLVKGLQVMEKRLNPRNTKVGRRAVNSSGVRVKQFEASRPATTMTKREPDEEEESPTVVLRCFFAWFGAVCGKFSDKTTCPSLP